MKIALCDDNDFDRDNLCFFIKKYCLEHCLEVYILEYSSSEELLEDFSTLKEQPQLIFFDIFMDKITGMQAAKRLFQDNFSGGFIFTTTSPDFALQGYQVSAIDYILKPYTYDTLAKALDKCKKYILTYQQSIHFVSERLDMTVYHFDITYLESLLKKVIVHARDRAISTTKTLAQFEEELKSESAFIRIDRSFIINFNNVEKWNANKIFFKNGEEISLPVRNRKKVLQQLEDYYWSKIIVISKKEGE